MKDVIGKYFGMNLFKVKKEIIVCSGVVGILEFLMKRYEFLF